MMPILLTFWYTDQGEDFVPSIRRLPNVLAVREELKHHLSRGQMVPEGSHYLKVKRGALVVELTGCTAAEVLTA